MGVNFRPPAASGGQGDVKALYSYLFQLAEQLNVAFENVDAQGGGAAYRAMQLAGSDSIRGEIDATTSEAYQNLKALIIKTATQVTSDIRKKYLDLAQSYLAQSEYGTYAEFLQAQIELGADGVIANWDQTNMITTSVADFNEYIAQSDIYMQIGIVRENEDGTMEAGVVVGKNFQKVTIDGVETITSKDVYMLLTAEQISFWQDGVKRSSLSLEDFFVNKAYIDEVQTSLISSKTFGEELDISSNSSIELLNDRLALIVSSESSETSLVLTDTALTAIANNIDLTANESIKAAVEDANEGLKTEIEQTSDRLSLIVKSESTATNLELTDQMAAVISEEIKLVAGTPDSLQNSSVTINQNMVTIETPVFSVQNESTGMTLDEEGLSAEYVSAPNLAEKYTGGDSVYAGGTYYPSLSALASELNGKLLTQNITITLVSNVTGGAEFANICGGKITINGNGYSMYNPLSIRNCSSLFEINDVNFSYTAKGYAEYENCTVLLNSCVFNVTTEGIAEPALRIKNGARVRAKKTEFYNAYGLLLLLQEMAFCVLEECTGYANRPISMYVWSGSDLRAFGGYPSGEVVTDDGSNVLLSGAEDSGSTQPTPPSISEETFTCTASDTCRGSSNWDGSGYVWQGYTSSGVHRGYMWFSSLASAISGKTIVSATLKLTRVNGIGRSGATTLYAYYTTKTAASGTQSVSTAYGGELGSISNEETKVFDLPVEIIQQIADYGYGGIVLYSGESSYMNGRNYSRNYCKIYGAYSAYAPELTVTYQ